MTLPEDIYSQRILELAAALPRTARLATPEATATAHSKLCGSTVTVDLAMEGDVVTDYGQSVKACLLGQSSASVMGREVIGASAGELRAVGAAMRKMLKEGGPPPQGKWGDLAVLEPVRDYKARHASTLLVFDAVEDAIRQIEAKRGAKASAFGRACLRPSVERGEASDAARRADRQDAAACADRRLSLRHLAAARGQLPASAGLLGLCARGHRDERRLEGRLARAGETLPLPSLGQPRFRPGARSERRASSVRALALWALAAKPA